MEKRGKIDINCRKAKQDYYGENAVEHVPKELKLTIELIPENSWGNKISSPRREKVEKLFEKRKKKNEEIDLVDCLQFCDKYTIISKTEDILEKLQYGKKKKEFCTLLKELEELRNNLAHAQDIITANWPSIINLSNKAEEFLKRCETINGGKII